MIMSQYTVFFSLLYMKTAFLFRNCLQFSIEKFPPIAFPYLYSDLLWNQNYSKLCILLKLYG